MSSNGCLKLLSILGISLVMSACVPVERDKPASQANQTNAVSQTTGACESPGGPVSDGVIAYRCSVPALTFASCPLYYCRRCNNGTWGGEYSCRLR
jgi:hypothetical protein